MPTDPVAGRTRPVVVVTGASAGVGRAMADPQREHWLGFTTAEAILGTQALPAYADCRGAFSAFEGQETEEAEAPGRPDNLFEPVPGLHRTHGRFTGQEERLSLGASGAAARGFAFLAGLALAGGIGYAARAARRKERA